MKHLFAVLLVVGSLFPLPSPAAFPERAIRIVVPFAPGGGSDFVARVVASKMPEVLGQNGVVDNRPGAASLIGTQLVANSPNDGYTLLLADTPFAVNHVIYRGANYDPIKSFAAVMQLATTPMMLVVTPGLAATSTQEFIALAKAQPGRVAMANSGSGSITHLSGALLMSSAGIELNTVPYKGTGPALSDLMGGQVQSIVATAASVMPLVSGGKMRVLGVASNQRSPFAPTVPTLIEAGVKGYVVNNWYVLVAAANSPAAVITTMHKAYAKILQQPEVRDRFAAAIIEATPNSGPAELQQMIAAETARWTRVARESNIRLD